MELCLASFATVFHNDEEEEEEDDLNDEEHYSDPKTALTGEILEGIVSPRSAANKTKQSPSPKYNNDKYPFVPLAVVLALWTRVLLTAMRRRSGERSSQSQQEETELGQRRDAETAAYRVAMSLLSSSSSSGSGGGGWFEVRHTGGLRKRSTSSSNRSGAQEEEEYRLVTLSEEQHHLNNDQVEHQDDQDHDDEFDEDYDEVEIRFRDSHALRYAWSRHPALSGTVLTTPFVVLVSSRKTRHLSFGTHSSTRDRRSSRLDVSRVYSKTIGRTRRVSGYLDSFGRLRRSGK